MKKLKVFIFKTAFNGYAETIIKHKPVTKRSESVGVKKRNYKKPTSVQNAGFQKISEDITTNSDRIPDNKVLE